MKTEQWVVIEFDPATGREQVIDAADSFPEARRMATDRNRRETDRHGRPARAPFRFWFAASLHGHIPTPEWVRDLDLLERAHA